jgi:hypothetical protein
MNGSKRMVPCFDFRACLSTMLVVSENRRLCQSGSGRQGDGIENWTRDDDRERRQSGEHLGTEYERGRRLSKMEVSCVAFYWDGRPSDSLGFG